MLESSSPIMESGSMRMIPGKAVSALHTFLHIKEGKGLGLYLIKIQMEASVVLTFPLPG